MKHELTIGSKKLTFTLKKLQRAEECFLVSSLAVAILTNLKFKAK